VCFEVTFEGVQRWRYFNGSRYMIQDLRSSRGKSTTSEIGFNPGHLEERLTGGMQIVMMCEATHVPNSVK